MKSFVRNILFVAVALLYIVSTMGFGVHKCASEGSASLVVLFGETPCEYVHSHVDADGNAFTHAHDPAEHHDCSCHHYDCDSVEEHSGNCCSTSVYVLTHDQTTQEDVAIALPVVTLSNPFNSVMAQLMLQADTFAGGDSRDPFRAAVSPREPYALFCTLRV